jgi:hypothetical protein
VAAACGQGVIYIDYESWIPFEVFINKVHIPSKVDETIRVYSPQKDELDGWIG